MPRKTSVIPLKAVDLQALSPADSLELAFSAAARALRRPLPGVFPIEKLKHALAFKRDLLNGKRRRSDLKDAIRSLNSLFKTIDQACMAVDSYKWHVRKDFTGVMMETFYLVSKIVRLAEQKPLRFHESIAGILSQANDAAEEYARFKRMDPLRAINIEIQNQRDDLLKLQAQ